MRSARSVFIITGLVLAGLPSVLFAQDTSASQIAAVNAQVADAFTQAAASVKAKHPELAVQIYWSIVNRFPNHPDSPRAAKQAAYATEALKDRDASITAYKKALDLYPMSGYVPALKMRLAHSYEAKGDKTSAISELKDLIAKFPKSDAACEGLINLGLLYISRVGESKKNAVNWQLKDDADAVFKQAIDEFPSRRDICAKAELYRAGIAFERAKAGRVSWDQAIAQIQAVKDAHPDAPKAILARLELMEAEKALKNQDNSLALEHAESVISSYSDCRIELGWAHYLAGFASEQVNNIKGAIDHYSAVLSGNYTKADNFHDRDVTLYCLVRSGYCYAKQGEKDLATQAFQRVADAYPGTAQAKEAAAQLAKLKADRNVQK